MIDNTPAKSGGKASLNGEAPLSEADEIAAMLPWYVTGRISDSDKARIDAYAAAHPEVTRHIAVAREEADAVFAVNQATAPPRAALDHALEKLHASIAADPRAKYYATKASVLEQIGDWLAKLTSRQLAYAGIAAALLVAVQTASIGALLTRGTGHGYETATGPGATALPGTFALVAFQPTAPAGELSKFLAEHRFTIVEGPISGGVFRVRIGAENLSDDAMGQAIDQLKTRADLVSFATATAKSE
ncbi:MAG: hypothetical protein ACKVP4_10405 [Hyphomicrobium sp.]